jgi:hypothetical protein
LFFLESWVFTQKFNEGVNSGYINMKNYLSKRMSMRKYSFLPLHLTLHLYTSSTGTIFKQMQIILQIKALSCNKYIVDHQKILNYMT